MKAWRYQSPSSTPRARVSHKADHSHLLTVTPGSRSRDREPVFYISTILRTIQSFIRLYCLHHQIMLLFWVFTGLEFKNGLVGILLCLKTTTRNTFYLLESCENQPKPKKVTIWALETVFYFACKYNTQILLEWPVHDSEIHHYGSAYFAL